MSTFFAPTPCGGATPSPATVTAAGALTALSANAPGPTVTVRMVYAPAKAGVKRGSGEMRDGEPEEVERSAPIPSPHNAVAHIPRPQGPLVHPCMTTPTPTQRHKIMHSLRLVLDAQHHQTLCMHMTEGPASPFVAMVFHLSGVPYSKAFGAALLSMIKAEVFRAEDALQASAMMIQKHLPEGPVFSYTNSIVTALNNPPGEPH